MKIDLLVIMVLLLLVGCSKNESTPGSTSSVTWNGAINPYPAIPVSKSVNKKVFAHYMPWFETPSTSSNGVWGSHWKMNNQNPPATIASHYYPLNTMYYTAGGYVTAPYGTSDTVLIDYQLLLMKLSGIDGIFIDWPGTLNVLDFQKNVQNSNAVISRIAKAGLKYAIVYEDQNLQNVAPSNASAQIAQAQTDMEYIQTTYFSDANYEKFNGKPVFLDFGPFGPIQAAGDWNNIFSVMTTPPAFFPYEGSASKGGTNVVGEFAWVQQSNLSNLNAFYGNGNGEEKITAVYPGFNTFYAQGGWPGPTWTIDFGSGTSTAFDQTLSLALTQPGQYIQLETWNDYGEGTMIEPTTQYQYSFLTTLQQQLGVQSSLSVSDLQAVAKLYNSRQVNILPTYNTDKLNELNQIYYYMASLKMDSAKALLQKDF